MGNAANIVRDFGTISIGGSDIGYVDPFEGAVDLIPNFTDLEIVPVETGVLERILFLGVQYRLRVVAAENNTASVAAALQGYASAGNYTIDADTYTPGVDWPSVAFSFVGRVFTLTASKAYCRVTNDPHNIGIPGRSQFWAMDVRFAKHTDGSILTRADTA